MLNLSSINQWSHNEKKNREREEEEKEEEEEEHERITQLSSSDRLCKFMPTNFPICSIHPNWIIPIEY